MANTNAPSLLYFFEHMFLRDTVFGNPEFLKGLLEKPDSIREELIANFNKIKEIPNDGLLEKDVSLTEGDFSSEKVVLENGDKMVVIKCPAPSKAPETGFIGIILKSVPRYFVSEYETNEEMRQLYPDKEWVPKYILCEWVEKNHKTYGEIPSTKEGFVAGVSKVVLGSFSGSQN